MKALNQGFSYIGVTVATFIATTAIVAVFTLVNFSLSSSYLSADRFIASGLAQEGIEVVRGVRQSYADWKDWDWYSTTTPIVHPVGDTKEYCFLQYDTTNLDVVLCGSETPLLLNESGVFYQYQNGVNSGFYRKIKLTRLSEDEIKVEAEVKWQSKAGDWHSLKVQDRLLRWK